MTSALQKLKSIDLQKIKRRLQSRTVLAVTVRSGSISVVLIREDEGKIQSLHPITLPIGGESILSNPTKTGEEMATALAAAGVREKKCVLCVPPGWALTSSAEMPELSGEDLDSYLELRAEREFPIAASELRLAHCEYGGADGKNRATIAALPSKRLAAIEQMLDAAGCRAVSISLGLDRCLPRGEMRPAVHFLANGNHVDVVITAGGGIASVRSLSTPAAPRDAAFDAAGFCREIRITLGRLPDAVRQQVRSARFGGAPASAEMLCNKTRDQLTRMGLESVDCGSGASDVFADEPAVQAAEHYLRRERTAFEFVRPEIKKWQTWLQRFDSRQQRIVVAAALGLIVLPILALVVRSRIEGNLEAEWSAMRNQVEELESLQGKIRQFRPWFDATPSAVVMLEGLIESFPDQGDVWAKSIQVAEGSKVTCTGFARNQTAFIAMVEKLRARPDVAAVQVQQVRGENPVQFSVTYKWELKNAQ